MAMANYRIRGPGLSYDEEFQHHGVLGQRWGVITRNVGVNYIPVGQRTGTGSVSGAKDVVTKGVNSFVTGVKNIKAKYDAKQAQKPLNINKLSRRKISKLTDIELRNAIERARLEEDLYKRTHPNVGEKTVNGKNAVAAEILRFTKDVGYGLMKDYAQNSLKVALRDHILKDNTLTDEQKLDKLSLYGFRVPGELDRLVKDRTAALEYEKDSAKVIDVFVKHGIYTQDAKGNLKLNENAKAKLVSDAMTEINAKKLGYLVSDETKSLLKMLSDGDKYDSLSRGVNLKDPKEAYQLFRGAKELGVENQVPAEVIAKAYVGQAQIAGQSLGDFINSINSDTSLDSSTKSMVIDMGTKELGKWLGVKVGEGKKEKSGDGGGDKKEGKGDKSKEGKGSQQSPNTFAINILNGMGGGQQATFDPYEIYKSTGIFVPNGYQYRNQ